MRRWGGGVKGATGGVLEAQQVHGSSPRLERCSLVLGGVLQVSDFSRRRALPRPTGPKVHVSSWAKTA